MSILYQIVTNCIKVLQKLNENHSHLAATKKGGTQPARIVQDYYVAAFARRIANRCQCSPLASARSRIVPCLRASIQFRAIKTRFSSGFTAPD